MERNLYFLTGGWYPIPRVLFQTIRHPIYTFALIHAVDTGKDILIVSNRTGTDLDELIPTGTPGHPDGIDLDGFLFTFLDSDTIGDQRLLALEQIELESMAWPLYRQGLIGARTVPGMVEFWNVQCPGLGGPLQEALEMVAVYCNLCKVHGLACRMLK